MVSNFIQKMLFYFKLFKQVLSKQTWFQCFCSYQRIDMSWFFLYLWNNEFIFFLPVICLKIEWILPWRLGCKILLQVLTIYLSCRCCNLNICYYIFLVKVILTVMKRDKNWKLCKIYIYIKNTHTFPDMLILHEFPDKILSMPLKLVRNSFNRKKTVV